MYAYTYSTQLRLAEIDEDTYIEDVLDNKNTDYNFGVDLAVYGRWKRLRAGILARNVNAPKFDLPQPTINIQGLRKNLRLNPQVRLGLAYLLLDNLIMAMDVDLTKNKTFFGMLPGVESYSQKVHFGIEWTPFTPISLRAGLYRNMSNDEIPIVITAGLGINIWSFHMDIGAAASTTRDKVEGVEWPTEGNVGLSFSLIF